MRRSFGCMRRRHLDLLLFEQNPGISPDRQRCITAVNTAEVQKCVYTNSSVTYTIMGRSQKKGYFSSHSRKLLSEINLRRQFKPQKDIHEMLTKPHMRSSWETR